MMKLCRQTCLQFNHEMKEVIAKEGSSCKWIFMEMSQVGGRMTQSHSLNASNCFNTLFG